eukprot:GHVU01222175.1.p1 GENE.GHVU01222175.1~~GHVU01222175.1.p1  ORF type:complete len:199 (+),score=21.12 GHVU01222175.1:777-1373(+)
MEDAYGRQKAGSNPITGLQPYTVEPDLILQVRMERHFCSPSLVCMPISHSLTHSLAFKQQLLLQSEGHFPPSFTSAQSARAGAPRGRLRSLSSLPDLESTGALLLVLRDSLSCSGGPREQTETDGDGGSNANAHTHTRTHAPTLHHPSTSRLFGVSEFVAPRTERNQRRRSSVHDASTATPVVANNPPYQSRTSPGEL